MSDEILAAIEASNTAFQEFKTRQERRLDALETKAGRPNLGNSGNDQSPEVKAFSTYVKTGDASGLETKGMSVGSGPDGGFAVPKEIDATIDSIALKMSPIRQLASIVQVGTSDYHRLVNLRGWQASWVGETDARVSTTTATLADIVPPMGELYANPQATQKMLDDVFFNADSWLLSELAAAFVEAESSAFVSGTGVAQPRGFMTAPFAATADATRAFGTVEYIPTGSSGAFAANSVDVFMTALSHMKAGYLDPNECAWLMNAKTFATALAVKDTLDRSLIMPSFAAGGPPTLLGYPVRIAEHLDDIAANSYSIMFANWKRFYLIVDRIGTRVLRDPFSNKPYVGFYTTKRVGGSVLNSEAAKAIKFSAS